MEYSNADPQEGRSWPYQNLLLPLREVYPDTASFDFVARLNAVGKAEMNRELVALVEEMRPDVTIVTLVTDEFYPETIHAIRRATTTVAYLFDDSWRREHSNFWAGHFDFVTTSEQAGVERFRAAGFHNAILAPMSFNERLYVRTDVPKQYDVSFLGQYHPYRAWLIDLVRKTGAKTAVFGPGWSSGTVTYEELVHVINASRINLNLSNSIHWDPLYLSSSMTALKWTIRASMARNAKRQEQLKGRHFEIAGCGGFQLSYHYAGVAEHFIVDQEIVTYRSSGDLVRKVRYFLENEDRRQEIADAGWHRAQAEHTSRRRVHDLVQTALDRRQSREGAPSITIGDRG